MESLHNRLREKIQDEIVKRLYRWAVGECAGPVRMAFSLTERCDLRCLYCTGILIHKGLYYPKELIKEENELSKEEWIRLAREGTELGIMEWSVCGGEPLMRSDTLLAMIHTIKKLNQKAVIELATNGTFLTAKIAERLVRLECDIIQLSIDGGNAKTHDFLRGKKGSFRSVTNAGKQLTSMKKRFGKEKPVIQVCTVINSRNYNELPKLASLAHSIGAAHFVANPMRVADKNIPFIKRANLELTNKQITQFHEIWKKVEEVEKQLGIEVRTGFYGRGVKLTGEEELMYEKPFLQRRINHFLNVFCFGPFYSLSVDAIGGVGRCASAHKTAPSVNLRTRSLREVWYGKLFESARKLMFKGKPLGDECKTCGIVTQRFFIRSRLSDLVGRERPQIRTHKRGRKLDT
jgi:MoaA/NifB/PqqE/SkfB family radical SAM enzyme